MMAGTWPATYYPGTKGKESIPVVLLHGDKGSRKDFPSDDGLVKFLQDKGYAVLVPDFRFHGDSAKDSAKENTKGKPAPKAKSAKSLPTQAYRDMVEKDMLAVKRFLWKKNNEGKLNIDKLVLIGCEMGADIAIEATLYDAKGWDQGSPMVGPLKLGGFVKAIILISPSTKPLRGHEPAGYDFEPDVSERPRRNARGWQKRFWRSGQRLRPLQNNSGEQVHKQSPETPVEERTLIPFATRHQAARR